MAASSSVEGVVRSGGGLLVQNSLCTDLQPGFERVEGGGKSTIETPTPRSEEGDHA